MRRWRSNVERLPVLLDDVLQPVVVGILANQLPHLVACSGIEVIHDFRNDQPYSSRLQLRVHRPERLRRGIVDIVHRGRIDAEPAQRRLHGVREK